MGQKPRPKHTLAKHTPISDPGGHWGAGRTQYHSIFPKRESYRESISGDIAMFTSFGCRESGWKRWPKGWLGALREEDGCRTRTRGAFALWLCGLRALAQPVRMAGVRALLGVWSDCPRGGVEEHCMLLPHGPVRILLGGAWWDQGDKQDLTGRAQLFEPSLACGSSQRDKTERLAERC